MSQLKDEMLCWFFVVLLGLPWFIEFGPEPTNDAQSRAAGSDAGLAPYHGIAPPQCRAPGTSYAADYQQNEGGEPSLRLRLPT